jgi:phosphoglycolate phosphatase-like HAD superfamily hydrolase
VPATSLVLFDIDGTLLRNAGGHHREALIAGIRSVTGIETTLEGVSTSGMLDRDLIRGMLQAAGASERSINRSMEAIVAACQEYYLENCGSGLQDRLCRGVCDCLMQLRGAGAVLGLVTGNLTAIAWRKMELAGVRDFFAVGGFAQDGRTRARLARIAFQRAVKAGLVKRGCRVSLVGDHANDVAAAKANSFLAVAVATGLMPHEELQKLQPDVLLRDLSELEVRLLL